MRKICQELSVRHITTSGLRCHGHPRVSEMALGGVWDVTTLWGSKSGEQWLRPIETQNCRRPKPVAHSSMLLICTLTGGGGFPSLYIELRDLCDA